MKILFDAIKYNTCENTGIPFELSSTIVKDINHSRPDILLVIQCMFSRVNYHFNPEIYQKFLDEVSKKVEEDIKIQPLHSAINSYCVDPDVY